MIYYMVAASSSLGSAVGNSNNTIPVPPLYSTLSRDGGSTSAVHVLQASFPITVKDLPLSVMHMHVWDYPAEVRVEIQCAI